ncbi:hypothetical protein, partial [Clostridium perfringens]
PTPNQFAHFAAARSDPRLFATANHGRPPIVATARPMATGRVPGGDPRRGGWQPHGAPPPAGAAMIAAAGYRSPHAPGAGGMPHGAPDPA